MIRAGAIVPHAPVLVEGVAGTNLPAVAPVARAAASSVRDFDGTLVLLSPHGAATGVYETVAGDLDSFGVRGLGAEMITEPDLARALAERWGTTVFDRPADYGITVPLLLGCGDGKRVVAATIAETTPVEESLDTARAFAAALRDVANEIDLVFVASAHTSSALSARAPLGFLPRADAADGRFLDSLRSGEGLGDAVTALVADGASCGPAPLVAWAAIFDGTRTEVLAYERLFGVGYVVARARP